jgi:SNF2 family DNA or RNA helicase
MTAHQILSGGWDVLVCSYEFVEASSKKARNFLDELTKYNNRGRVGERPKRPNAGISSGLWRLLGIPIKRLILDEVQVVNKRSGARHKAIMKLPAKAIVGLSGTLPHNRWHDMSGYFDFLKSHPFKSHADFMATFASQDAYGKSVRPDAARLRLLQRCLQAVLIARPSSVLKLPPCRRNLAIFDLLPATRKKVDEYTTKYLQMAVMSAETEGLDFGEKNESYALAYAVIAQLWSLHPLLGSTAEEAKDRKVKLAQTGEGEVSPGAQFEAEDQEARNGEARVLWLQKVEDYDQLVNSSMRLLSIISIINQVREASPKAKIVVFSQYLKFLDILDVALRRDVGVRTIRFDGTVHPLTRRRRLEEFAEEKEGVVLLITAGAGGVGLNITEASVVLICEEWWNGNAERQCICRVWRQGRDEETLVFNFRGTNSAICGVISSGRKAKDRINKELMGPLVRGHKEPPVILELLHQRGLSPQKFEDLDVLMTEGF